MRRRMTTLAAVLGGAFLAAGCGGSGSGSGSTSGSASGAGVGPYGAKVGATTGATAAAAPAAALAVIEGAPQELSLVPASARVEAGRLTVKVQNKGQREHELVIIRTDRDAAALLKGAEAEETGAVGEIEGIEPGTAKTASFELKPGHYALICNEPGHYAGGMHANLTVR